MSGMREGAQRSAQTLLRASGESHEALRTARIHAYFAPIDRVSHTPTLFDPAALAAFALEEPPAPWRELGPVFDFKRVCETKTVPVLAGAPAMMKAQVRSDVQARVSFSFARWGKLQLALTSGTQQMNVLRTESGAIAAGSGGVALAAVVMTPGSTATALQVGAAANTFAAGDVVAVDVDYTGQTGYIGSGVSGAYLPKALTDVDYVRRVTLNVARIAAVSNGSLVLEHALPAGVPTAAMKVSAVAAFCDREGSSFFQEWSALFVEESATGERVAWHYPRLQSVTGAAEAITASAAGGHTLRLSGEFQALPVTDAVDRERVVCFRSFLPAR